LIAASDPCCRVFKESPAHYHTSQSSPHLQPPLISRQSCESQWILRLQIPRIHVFNARGQSLCDEFHARTPRAAMRLRRVPTTALPNARRLIGGNTCKCLRTQKALYSVSWLLQEVFLPLQREGVQQTHCQDRDKEWKMYIHEGRYKQNLTEYGCIQPFTGDLCQEIHEKMAVLVHLACDHAVGWMQEIVKCVLAGMCC
jgi:hypothetical protein